MMGRRKERRPLVDPVFFFFFFLFLAIFQFLFGIFILQSTLIESNKEKAKTKRNKTK